MFIDNEIRDTSKTWCCSNCGAIYFGYNISGDWLRMDEEKCSECSIKAANLLNNHICFYYLW